MTSKESTWKRISIIFIGTILLSSAVTFNSGYFEAEAKKPGSDTEGPISWSNGFPSGPHSNVNIHGKKLNFNCDNDGKTSADFGSSVFVPLNTTAARDANQAPTNIDNATIGDINFVSNKRSTIEKAIVRDPCSAPFGNTTAPSTGDNNTAALVELPPGEHQVYWRILGNHGGGPNKDISEAMITNPALLDTCDFLPTEYTDGSVVQWFDPDCTDCEAGDPTSGSQVLTYFENGTEMYENSTMPDTGFSLNETIYSKAVMVGFNEVEVGDTRVANAFSWGFDDGDQVAGGADVGEPLFNFTMNFMYNDTATAGFSVDETVYNATTLDGFDVISPGDIRVANAASVGLDEDAGEDLLTCTDSEQLVGLGLVSNKGTFLKTEDELVRFGDDDNTFDKGNGNKKGKSNAINMTKLFVWTGSVCEAAVLDSNEDNKLTIEDFDVVITAGHTDANVTTADLDEIEILYGLIIDPMTILDNDTDGDGGIEVNEFDGWIQDALDSMTNLDGDNVCRFFETEWVFNVADIVLYGFDYENKGSSLTQLRFYPVEETSFTSEE